jgi:hypothetical protein
LQDHAPGFSNEIKGLRAVLHFWHNASGHSQANINMNQGMNGINVDMGHGNVGGVGIRHRAAQGSSIQSVTIFARDAFAGLMGGAGSGGSHIAVTVIGGRFGVDYRGAQPASTIAGFKLINQSCAGVLYCGLMSLSVVGLELSSAEPTFVQAIIGDTGDGPELVTHLLAVAPKARVVGLCKPPGWSWCEGNPEYGINTPGTRAIHGQISVVDSSFDGPPPTRAAVTEAAAEPRTAIDQTSNTLYLKNVYVRGFALLAKFVRSGRVIALRSAQDWSLVNEFVHGEPPPLLNYKGWWSNMTRYQLQAPIVIDGVRTLDVDIVNISKAQTVEPPPNLRERHLWGSEASFPSFQTPGAIDATLPPFSAKGDGIHDDEKAINAALVAAAAAAVRVVYLPKGVYRLGAGLKVPQGVALVGTAHHLCVLVPTVGMSPAVASRGELAEPLVHMLGPNSAGDGFADTPGSTLSGLMIATWRLATQVMAYQWDARGDSNVLRGCSTWILSPLLCELQLPAKQCATPQSPAPSFVGPMTTVTGSGKFYVVHHEDGYFESQDYRHLLITGVVAERRAFYHLNPEHAQSDANIEIRDGGAVDIFGMKSEGLYVVMWLRNVTDVNLYGYGGNACPGKSYPPGFVQQPTLFRVDDSSDVSLVNLISYDMASTLALSGTAAGLQVTNSDRACQAPDQWLSVVERRDGRNVSSTLALDRPVLWRRTAAPAGVQLKTDSEFESRGSEVSSSQVRWLSTGTVVNDAVAVLAAGGCPCQNASLCLPITRTGPEEVYAFHIGSISYCPHCTGFTQRTTWRKYDWSQITTIGYQNWHSPAWPRDTMEPELLCHAHANNVRVTLLPPPTVWGTPADWSSVPFVDNATKFMAAAVTSVFADGYDIDIEKDIRGKYDTNTTVHALTALVKVAVSTMHAANPHSHVTMATPSEGSGENACGVMYGRLYDWLALSKLVDFFVVMDCALRSCSLLFCRQF